MRKIYLKVSDLVVEISGEDRYLDLYRLDKYKQFLVEKAEDIEFRLEAVFCEKSELERELDNSKVVLSWEGDGFYFQRNDGMNIFRLFDQDDELGNNYMLVNNDYTFGRILLSNDFDYREYFHNDMMVIYSSILSKKEGMLLHCSCVKDLRLNKIYAFSGQSGNGKSTIGKIFASRDKDFCVLNDERVVIRMIDGKTMCYGTPWYSASKLCYNDSGILDTIFFIEHGKTNFCEEKGYADGCHNVISNFYFFPKWKNTFVRNSLTIAREIAKSVKMKRLGFIPTEEVIEFVRSSI